MTFKATNEDQSGQTSRGKVILLNYDAYNALPGDTCLYCLTDRQQMILLALLPFVGWGTRWYSPTNATILKDTIEGYQADLAAALMSDVCADIMAKLDTIIEKENTIETKINDFELDMNISQAAQDVAIAAIAADLTTLSVAVGVVSAAIAGIATIVTSTQGTVNEMSDDVDNIETIVTASATEITETGADVDNIELLTLKTKSNVTNVYVQNTLVTINLAVPNVNYITDTTDTTATQTYARYNAFCASIVQWMYTEVYAVMSALSASPTDLATLALQMTATGLSLQALASYGIPAFTVAEIYAAVSDTAAVNDVACAMIAQLTSQKPAFETFITALNAYVAPAYPDHRWILSQTIGLAFAYLDAYTVFASLYKSEYETILATVPTGYVCPPCGTFTYPCVLATTTWDFSLGQKGYWLFPRGIMTLSQGVVGNQIPGDPQFGFDVILNIGNPSVGCNGLDQFNFTYIKLPSGGNSFILEQHWWAGGHDNVNQSFISSVSSSTSTVFITALGSLDSTRFYTKLRLHTTEDYYGSPGQTVTASVLKSVNIHHI